MPQPNASRAGNTAHTRDWRPCVAANFALTADGKASTRNRTPARFTSATDKRRLLEIRAGGDAVMAGHHTVAIDNMAMGLPAPDLAAARKRKGKRPLPLRVLVSNSGKVDPGLKVFRTEPDGLILFTTRRASASRIKEFESRGAHVHVTQADTVDLAQALRVLRSTFQVERLIVEGGPQLFRALLEEDLVDEINLTLCPVLFGGAAAPTLTGIPGAFLPRSIPLRIRKFEVLGEECFLKFEVIR
jgi:riboflavin-specific deaminase-like protein